MEIHGMGEMPDQVRQALMKVLGGQKTEDTTTCPEGKCAHRQVAKLGGNELLLLKTDIAKSDERKRESDLAASRIRLLLAENNQMWSEFWEVVYKKFGLLSKAEYHWTKDGRILLIEED